MTEQRRFQSHIAWAKERLDEMDASLAALERWTGEVKATARATVDRSIADLHYLREQFQQTMNTALKVGATEWERGKAQLESQWKSFDTELSKAMEAFGAQVAVRRAMFRGLIAAQRRAWRDVADRVHSSADGVASDCRTEIEKVVQKIKADQSQAGERLQNILEAGSETWVAFKGALAESRSAFDRSIEAAENAFKRAAKTEAEGKSKERPPN